MFRDRVRALWRTEKFRRAVADVFSWLGVGAALVGAPIAMVASAGWDVPLVVLGSGIWLVVLGWFFPVRRS